MSRCRRDHVAPPQIDLYGGWFRVPCRVISPYSKIGFTDSAVNDYMSILHFTGDRFVLSPLSTQDKSANNLMEAFEFTGTGKICTDLIGIRNIIFNIPSEGALKNI